jgi:glutamate-1-semialdehyde aminotransferase
MGPVVVLTFAFIGITLLAKMICEHLEFMFKSNLKYKILDYLGDYIYYGKDIGIEASLSLDSPNGDVLERRKTGQAYLASKLNPVDGKENARGQELASKLVDCRFALAKVCMPLMRELEFPAKRNFLTELRNRKQSNDSGYAKGMFEVDTSTMSNLMYVGNDAVHTLGIEAFHAPIQEEINKRMSLMNGDKDGALRFAPLSLNAELEKNTNMILELTGMDQVRYSLSGSEAVDAALKDVKSSCRNKKIVVRFSSAYHGHVSGVDYLNCQDHIFLKECSQESIEFIEKYHYRIAAVIVNPMQHFTGVNKASPPGEKLTLSSRIRSAVPREEYARWLHDLQERCDYCTKYLTRVALILDDIYFAFRIPELFSKDYFVHPDTGASLKPNVVILGKGVAAGYPLSMVVAQRGYLNTYDKKFLLLVNKTVGTLSAYNAGIVASNTFLEAITGQNISILPSPKTQLADMVKKFDAFSVRLNDKFNSENLPLRIRNFSNTFSIDFLSKSLYNSRYPQYLMAEGIYLGNYSTGKFNLTNDCTEEDLEILGDTFIAAGLKMRQHGFFEPTSKAGKKKMFATLAWRFSSVMAQKYYKTIMEDKHIDIEVSHNHPVNKFGHFWSSVFMIVVAYPYIFVHGDTIKGCMWFFFTHAIRQSGHFFYEQQDKDIEKRKFGHKDKSKKKAAAALLVAGVMYNFRAEIFEYLRAQFGDLIPFLRVDQYVGLVALFTVIPHYVEITYQFGVLRGISWALKIITDPFTDLLDFYRYCVIHPKYFLDLKDQRAVYRLCLKTKTVKKLD